MTYFNKVPDFKTYANSDADFHFIYNANTGGGQSFFGGKFYDADGNLVSPVALNGRMGIFRFSRTDETGTSRFITLDETASQYEIKPRAEGDSNMKLSVGNKPTPSSVVAAFLMLPEPCGVKRSSNLDVSALSSGNYWVQSMWLSVDATKEGVALLMPKDIVLCGGIDKQGHGTAIYFSVDFQARIDTILGIAKRSVADGEIEQFVKYFSDTYTSAKAFSYEESVSKIKAMMKHLSAKYPERYSGILDPLPMIADLTGYTMPSPACVASGGAFERPDILAAIRTKPFILLAGISGTGKSRIVRQLARGCCPEYKDEAKTQKHPLFNEQKPGNFEMIQVRPNWHDSTQLMGYESRVSGKAEFVVKPFVKFLAKAWLYEEEGIPFFLCLDEMNLAPVEQYFAEYLSVIETRKTVNGKIVTDPLVTFPNEALLREAFKEIYQGVDHDKAEQFINKFIVEGGIPIPQNFIVMGTVNMDETTFSFSRKVLDRAMSFELNEVDMGGGLAADPNCQFGAIDMTAAKCEFTQGFEVYAAAQADCDKIKAFLLEVNKVLDKTPFKIAYRTRNEIMIYCHERAKDGVPLAQALDEATSMKILSRVEGDKRRLVVRDAELAEYNGKSLLDSLLDVILKGLKAVRGGEADYTESDVCSKKLREMRGQLENGYTSFWTR